MKIIAVYFQRLSLTQIEFDRYLILSAILFQDVSKKWLNAAV